MEAGRYASACISLWSVIFRTIRSADYLYSKRRNLFSRSTASGLFLWSLRLPGPGDNRPAKLGIRIYY